METCDASWETKDAAFPGKSLQKISPGKWRLSHSSHGLPEGKNSHLSSLSRTHPNEAEPLAVAEMQGSQWILEAEPSICSRGSGVPYSLIDMCVYPMSEASCCCVKCLLSSWEKRASSKGNWVLPKIFSWLWTWDLCKVILLLSGPWPPLCKIKKVGFHSRPRLSSAKRHVVFGSHNAFKNFLYINCQHVKIGSICVQMYMWRFWKAC